MGAEQLAEWQKEPGPRPLIELTETPDEVWGTLTVPKHKDFATNLRGLIPRENLIRAESTLIEGWDVFFVQGPDIANATELAKLFFSDTIVTVRKAPSRTQTDPGKNGSGATGKEDEAPF